METPLRIAPLEFTMRGKRKGVLTYRIIDKYSDKSYLKLGISIVTLLIASCDINLTLKSPVCV